ncbi:aldolase/citrate lyase family protein [Marispirochaeta sp.]|uniref:HpcH/HpaI aldolase family protein n=1 Tax=Marispirochaeta sp. TaxID=2038653 RepID=UPI0029C6E376|nr:aldolase/citrate lyase family protein [Marispirochaeta sp.]
MKNQLKRTLASGKHALGAWVTIPSPDVSEAMSTLDLDWLLFDLEHSGLNEQYAQVLMQGMRGDRVTPLIRVAWNDPVLIKKALDIGAHGVIVPMVNTRKDALKAVQACTYPPKGIRGCGPKRPWIYDPEYTDTADEEVLMIPQIETLEAVNNADEIFSVEGVDVCFVGPFDLSVSMGFRGKQEDPEFQAVVDKVLLAAKRHNVVPGMWLGAGRPVTERLKAGWKFISIGLDLNLLVDGTKAALKKALD